MPDHCLSSVWLHQQRLLRTDLLTARDDPASIAAAVARSVSRYDAYHQARLLFARSDPALFLAAPWATPLERATYWLAGWRPNTIIHLLYSESGRLFEAQLEDLLLGVHSGDLGDLSAAQMARVDELQRRTIGEEDEIGDEMAELQTGAAAPIGESDLEEKIGRLQAIVARAEELRMRTLREVVEILKPVQAADLLVAAADLEIGLRQAGLARAGGGR